MSEFLGNFTVVRKAFEDHIGVFSRQNTQEVSLCFGYETTLISSFCRQVQVCPRKQSIQNYGSWQPATHYSYYAVRKVWNSEDFLPFFPSMLIGIVVNVAKDFLAWWPNNHFPSFSIAGFITLRRPIVCRNRS